MSHPETPRRSGSDCSSGRSLAPSRMTGTHMKGGAGGGAPGVQLGVQALRRCQPPGHCQDVRTSPSVPLWQDPGSQMVGQPGKALGPVPRGPPHPPKSSVLPAASALEPPRSLQSAWLQVSPPYLRTGSRDDWLLFIQPLAWSWASLVAQMVKRMFAMW